MTELDDKLHGILNEWVSPMTAGMIDRIKQAFADAGYTNARSYDLHQGFTGSEVKTDTLMTGQEWYERFLKELPDDYQYDMKTMVMCEDAAKRASGLTDD